MFFRITLYLEIAVARSIMIQHMNIWNGQNLSLYRIIKVIDPYYFYYSTLFSITMYKRLSLECKLWKVASIIFANLPMEI